MRGINFIEACAPLMRFFSLLGEAMIGKHGTSKYPFQMQICIEALETSNSLLI